MKSILEVIKPIVLLHGPHEDTAQTGHGCFMNVVSYLNGDAVITDDSPCVCSLATPVAMMLNDNLDPAKRQLMMPFIQRALGSETTDFVEKFRRMKLFETFVGECQERLFEAKAYIAGNPSKIFEDSRRGWDIDVNRATDCLDGTLSLIRSEIHYAEQTSILDFEGLRTCANMWHSAAGFHICALIRIRPSPIDEGLFFRQKLLARYMEFFDEVLPRTEAVSETVLVRGQELVKMFDDNLITLQE